MSFGTTLNRTPRPAVRGISLFDGFGWSHPTKAATRFLNMQYEGMDYHEAAGKQKELCISGKHLHCVMTEGGYRLQVEKPEHSYDWECCPCFGCCFPDLRRTVQ